MELNLNEFLPIRSEEQKNKRIRTEVSKLKKHYKDLPANKLFIAQRLIERAAFQKITLEDLEKEINETGYTEIYQNGEKQSGVKQSAALSAYNAMYKNYQATLRDLAGMVPAEVKTSRLAEFMKENG